LSTWLLCDEMSDSSSERIVLISESCSSCSSRSLRPCRSTRLPIIEVSAPARCAPGWPGFWIRAAAWFCRILLCASMKSFISAELCSLFAVRFLFSALLPSLFCTESRKTLPDESNLVVLPGELQVPCCLGSISSSAFVFGAPFALAGFLSSLTLSAYLRVLRVCSQQESDGEMLPIITVLQLPTKLSLRTMVSLDWRNGVCFWSRSRALMHSFSASRLLLISAPSCLVCLSWS